MPNKDKAKNAAAASKTYQQEKEKEKVDSANPYRKSAV
jgi:hypothetical protein